MKNEIQLVASFGIMLIMMLSNFGLCGVVGVWLSSFFFGIFGCVQYVMPVAFFLMVTVLLANDYSLLAMKKCGAGFVVLTMVSAYAQLICRQDVREFYDLFTVAATDRGAGGILGGGISLLLQSWFGTPGADPAIFRRIFPPGDRTDPRSMERSGRKAETGCQRAGDRTG